MGHRLSHAHFCRECIVIAKSQLLHGHSIVLIDDWDSAHLEQLLESVAGIEVLVSVGQIVQGQQHLSTLLHSQEIVSANA